MKWYWRISLLFLVLTINAYADTQEAIPRSIKIKVLLNEYQTDKKHVFKIKTKEKLFLKIKKSKTYSMRTPRLEIMTKNNALYARNKIGPFKKIRSDELHIKSHHPIVVNDKQYSGIISLQLCSKTKKLYLINKLDLEDYVYAVLLAESYQTWPHEMQKIQAITSRTYAVHQMINQQKRKNKKMYDIKRNTYHQRYNGNHNYIHLRRAVTDTKNLILTYRGDVVLTMFDACCGGSTPAYMQGINFDKAPYLARNTPCKYCKKYRLYRWKRKLPVTTFLNYLYKYPPIARKLSKHKTLHSIQITKQDKAGIVHKIKISQTPKKSIFVSGKDLWMSMSNLIRSQNFVIKKEKNNILISGKGFGHQIGLCQRGARELVRCGWPLKKILAFYYPNTNPARLTTG